MKIIKEYESLLKVCKWVIGKNPMFRQVECKQCDYFNKLSAFI